MHILTADVLCLLSNTDLPIAVEEFYGTVLPILGVELNHIIPSAYLWVNVKGAASRQSTD